MCSTRKCPIMNKGIAFLRGPTKRTGDIRDDQRFLGVCGALEVFVESRERAQHSRLSPV